jgi:hypothetical protein
VNTLLLALALVVASTDPSFVLGAETSRVMERWVDGLSGLKVDSAKIDKDHVIVELSSTCVIRLTHDPDVACAAAYRLGETHGCVVGARCPSEAKLRRAFDKAGPLKLPWRSVSGAPTRSSDQVREARVIAQRRLDARDPMGAQRTLLPVARNQALRARDRLSVVATLGVIGAGGEAWSVLADPSWGSEDPALLTLARLVLLTGPGLAEPLAEALLEPENACGAIGIASGLLAGRRFREAARLSSAVRAMAPTCFEAYRAEMTALAATRDHGTLAQVFAAAVAQFGADERLAPLREMAWYAADDVESIVASLEARVEKGERSAGLFKQLLALVVREKLRAEKMGSWLARAEANPKDRVAAFFAGVLLHYEREFERSNALLDRAAIELEDEPRLHIYRAMNAFNLGDRIQAEASITKAASLETQDPDIFYCQGEIYRDTDRARAREALAVYWFQTELNSDPNSSKQARVRGMMSAIDRCIAENTPAPCPGPWEHVFASARDTNQGSSDL